VLALAHALERYKTLSGEDVVAVLEHQHGPVVDGTPYGDATFMAELNEYHDSAAIAHRDHSQEQLSLPTAANGQPWTMPVVVAEPDAQGLNGQSDQRRRPEWGAERTDTHDGAEPADTPDGAEPTDTRDQS